MAQSFFPLDPVQVVDGGVLPVDAYFNVDVSALVPVGATGAIIYARNTNAGVRTWDMRMNGSGNNFAASGSGNIHCWGIVGLDANRIFQFYKGGATPTWQAYLIGYTLSGVTLLMNTILLTGAGLPPGVWTDIDLSALVPAETIGVILRIHSLAAPPWDWGVRMRGSTDNRIAQAGNQNNQYSALVGVDAARFIQGYHSAPALWIELQGWITEGAIFYENGIDMTPAAGVGWVNLVPPIVPLGRMGFFEIQCPPGGETALGLREDGVVTPPYPITAWGIIRHIWGISNSGAVNRIVEGRMFDANTTFHLTGYSVGATILPTVTTNQAIATGNSARMYGALDHDGLDSCDSGFEWGPTTAFGNTTPTESRRTGETFAQSISGLEGNKDYYFRAFATNPAGTSYGATRKFTTVTPQVRTLPATMITENSAQLNGVVEIDSGFSGDVSFEWGSFPSYGMVTPWVGAYGVNDAFLAPISLLAQGTGYHFRARFRNKYGTVYGNDVVFNTLSPVGLPILTDDSGLIRLLGGLA